MNKLKLLLLSLTLFLGACAEGRQASTMSPANSAPVGRVQTAEDRSDAPASKPVSLDQADKSKEPPVERKVIRNAEMTLEAASPEEAQQKIGSIVESRGGFVVDSQQSSSNAQATTHDRVTMTLRVPSDKFGEAIDEIRKASTRVVVETVKSQDITEEFIDVEARLKAKKALEAQFLEIMKQGKSIEDALNIQRELATVRGEIEQIEGRKRFLENQSALSTIKLTLQTPTVFSANSSGFIYQLGRSFSSGFDFALNFVMGFITFIVAILPFLVLVVLPLYLLVRYFWRRRNKRILADQLARDEESV